MEGLDQEMCKFYQLKCKKPIQVCLFMGKEWKDCFIAFEWNNKSFKLTGEITEEFGIRDREILATLLYCKKIIIDAEEIDEKNASESLRNIIKNIKR